MTVPARPLPSDPAPPLPPDPAATADPSVLTALSAPVVPCRVADLAGARRVVYRLEQTFRYDYDEPVASVRQRLVVVPPPRHGDAHRRHDALAVLVDADERPGAPGAARVLREEPVSGGAVGATVVRVEVERVQRRIEFSLRAVVERVVDDAPLLLPAAAADDPRLIAPTALTRPDDRLTSWAADLRQRDETPAATAERVCAAVHEAMTYRAGVTTERTTSAAAAALGAGVCQDFAHVMISLCRALGVPARYVSGHLIGQGGTHAWVEVLAAGARADRGGAARVIALDPTRGAPCGPGHLTVATGRDYADVAPTSGTYVGPPTGRLTSSRRLGVVDVVR